MSTNEKPSVDREKQTASQVQGEGDYESTRKYNKDTEHFLESADVSKLARKAAPASKEEAAKLKEAEDIGRSHAVGGKDAEKWPAEKPKTGH